MSEAEDAKTVRALVGPFLLQIPTEAKAVEIVTVSTEGVDETDTATLAGKPSVGDHEGTREET